MVLTCFKFYFPPSESCFPSHLLFCRWVVWVPYVVISIFLFHFRLHTHPPHTHTRKFLHVLSLFSPIYNFIVSYKPMKTHRIPQLFCLLISTHYVCLLAFDCSIVCILTKAPFFILHILAVQCKFAYHSKSLKWTWFIKTLDMWYKIITKQRDKKIDYFATLRKLAKYLKKIHTSHVLK